MEKKIIVITGVTRGIGRAMAEQFIASGHIVLGCGRTELDLKKLRRRFPEEHDFAQVDVAETKQVNDWAVRLIDQWGAPDILINNASIINRSASLWEISAEEFSSLIDINVKGMANTIRAFIPSIILRGKGMIVNFSSGWGRSTSPKVAPYCTSKWAIEGMTQALAQELPRGIIAVSLNPGVIDTEMLRSSWAADVSRFIKPSHWAEKAVPVLLNLSREDNGKQLTIR